MLRTSRLLLAGLVMLAALPAYAADGGVEGMYKLVQYSGNSELPLAVIKLENVDGKLTGTVVTAGGFGAKEVKAPVMDGKIVRFELPGSRVTGDFEGLVGSDGISGSFKLASSLTAAKLIKTDKEALGTSKQLGGFAKSEMQENLEKEVRELVTKIRPEKDEQKRDEMMKEYHAIQRKIAVEIAKAHRDFMEKNSEGPLVFTAVYGLLRDPKNKPTAEEAKKWVSAVTTEAAKYGPRLNHDTALRVAEQIGQIKDLKVLALEQAKKAEMGLTEKTGNEDRVRVFKVLLPALRNNGKTDEAKGIETQLAKIEATLDKEYVAKVPPFKPETFEGRKEKGDRKVVLELFTGAQCPPCVAADVAFDGLEKSYKPSELILLQYHLHIPGPDPMTNAETEARAKYYSISSTPSTRFNGKSPLRAGGGYMADSEKMYGSYRKVINPILEETTATKLVLKAAKVGDKIDIKAEVSGLKDPGEKKRLRFVLAEETIRYVGGNKLRFHHHVVRDLPGGVKGLALNEANSQHSVTVNLGDLKQKLEKYLDNYAENVSPFPYTDRPLDFKNLKVIALVQDDESKEILQVMQVDVDGELTTKK